MDVEVVRFQQLSTGERLRLLTQWLVAHPKTLLLTLVGLFALWGVVYPQRFINLWLTADQQGMIHFTQGRYSEAAESFENRQWKAYGFYADQSFERAAQIWSTSNEHEDLFAQANALAHISEFVSAAEIYQELLSQTPNDKNVIHNLKLIEEFAETTPKSKGKSGQGSALRMDESEEQEPEKEEATAAIPQMLPTDEMWLDQVKANPAFFLQKKFMLEHDNAKRNAQQNEETEE